MLPANTIRYSAMPLYSPKALPLQQPRFGMAGLTPRHELIYQLNEKLQGATDDLSLFLDGDKPKNVKITPKLILDYYLDPIANLIIGKFKDIDSNKRSVLYGDYFPERTAESCESYLRGSTSQLLPLFVGFAGKNTFNTLEFLFCLAVVKEAKENNRANHVAARETLNLLRKDAKAYVANTNVANFLITHLNQERNEWSPLYLKSENTLFAETEKFAGRLPKLIEKIGLRDTLHNVS